MKKLIPALLVTAFAVLLLPSLAQAAPAGPTLKTITSQHVTHDGVYREDVTAIKATWRPAGKGDGIDGTPDVTVTKHHARRNTVYCRTTQGAKGFHDHGNNWQDTLRVRYDDADNLPTPCSGPSGFTVVVHVKLDADGASKVTWKDYSNDPGNPVGQTKFSAPATKFGAHNENKSGTGSCAVGTYVRTFKYGAGSSWETDANVTQTVTYDPECQVFKHYPTIKNGDWKNTEEKAGHGYVLCPGSVGSVDNGTDSQKVQTSIFTRSWFFTHKGNSCKDDNGLEVTVDDEVWANGNWLLADTSEFHNGHQHG
jgi:hypothetical protein